MSAATVEVSKHIADLGLIGTALEKFSAVNAGLADLEARFDGLVFEVTTTKGMAEAKAARAAIRGPRLDVERLRKEAKAPLIDAGRRLDAEAERITAALEKIEEPIDEQIKTEEARRERERKAREEAELARVGAIQSSIDIIRAFPQTALGKTAAEVAAAIDDLDEIMIGDSFAEFADTARVAHFTSMAAMKNIHAERVTFEAEQERIRAEREELRLLRQAAAQRQEEVARAQKIEDDRKEAEREAEATAERKRIADERAKLAREREEFEARQASATPAVVIVPATSVGKTDLPPAPPAPPATAAAPVGPPSWPPSDAQLVQLVRDTYGVTAAKASRRLLNFGA